MSTDVRPPVPPATPAEMAVIDSIAGAASDTWRGGPRTGESTRLAVAPQRDQLRSQLLPTLIGLQQEIGGVTGGALSALAHRLAVPLAEAWGVATFYSLLDVESTGTDVTWVCTDLSCGAGQQRIEELRARGRDVRPSPCLGQCDRPPGTFSWNSVSTGATHVGGDPVLLRTREPYAVLESTLRERSSDQVRSEVGEAGLVGRGGAAFPVEVKWRSAAETPAAVRYVVCNADESEPGTFKDRLLLEEHTAAVLEGLILAGFAVGANVGYVYARGEYNFAYERLVDEVKQARAGGWLGEDLLGTGFSFDIEVRRGAGAYICGEETALLNSIEGRRGEPRVKPPFPTQVGLFGRPTVVNNVETLANIPLILQEGAEAYRRRGTDRSPGTKLFSVSGHTARPGVYELPFGTSLSELLEMAGAGEPDAVLLGGAAGTFVPKEDFALPLSFEGARHAGAMLGSGSVIVFAAGTDFHRVCTGIAEFFAHESCGQCVPCRIGTARQVEALRDERFDLLGDLDQVMTDASICGLGQTAASAIRSARALGLIGGSDV